MKVYFDQSKELYLLALSGAFQEEDKGVQHKDAIDKLADLINKLLDIDEGITEQIKH